MVCIKANIKAHLPKCIDLADENSCNGVKETEDLFEEKDNSSETVSGS